MSIWGPIDTANDARCREVRRCAKCSAPAVTVVHVTQHYSRGIPSGRTYAHRCGSCNVTFDSISVWRALTTLFAAAIITMIGFGITTTFVSALFEVGLAVFTEADGRTWGTWGVGFLMFFGGLAWVGWTTWLVARLTFLHPVAQTR
jgi:hypothetical protein